MLLIAAATAASQVGGWWGPLEIISHFTLQLALLALVLAIVAALARDWAALSLAALCSLGGVWVVVEPFASDPPREACGVKLVVMAHNVHSGNQNTADAIEYIRQVNPDVVIALEVTRNWLLALEALRPEFSVVVAEPREDNFGLAIVSRHEAAHATIVRPGDSGIGFAEAYFEVDGQRWSVLGIHPVPPLGFTWTRVRDEGLRFAAEWASKQPGPTVVAGDFNTTPYAASFRRLLQDGGLVDSRQGIAVAPTWPVASWIPCLMRIPIDHVLHNSKVITVSRQLGPASGSDHLPVVATLRATH